MSKWKECQLDDMLETLESGARPKGGVRGIENGIPSIGGEHLTYKGVFDFSNIKYIPDSFAQNMKKGIIKKHDVLVVKDGATTGKCAYVDDDFPFEFATINEHVFICRIKKEYSPKFIFLFLRSPIGQERILDNFQGSAQGGINKTFINNTLIPCPSTIEEQQLIVKWLETRLEKLNAVRERLEKIPLVLKRFRQSVLSAACSGRLTAKWREGKELPEWEEKTLRDVCDKFQYGTSTKSEKQGEVPVLRMGNIQNGKIDWNDLVFTSDITDIKKYALCFGDVLFNRTNSEEHVGKTAIYESNQQAIFAGYLIKIFNDKNRLNSRFLNYLLNSPKAREYCKLVKSDGVNQSNINAQKLADFVFLLPKPIEQEEIVRRVDVMFALAESIENRYRLVKYKLDKAERALYGKAFSGEL